MRHAGLSLLLLGTLLAASCGLYPSELTPAQKAAVEQAELSKLYLDYAKAQNLGLGASLANKPPISANGPSYGIQATTPTNVDLRPYCPPVYNQGPFRTCTGFAVAKGLGEYLLRRQGDATALSASHLYIGAKSAAMDAELKSMRDGLRFMDWQGFRDTGTSIASAMAALEMGGAVSEEDAPYPPATLWGHYWQSAIVPGNKFVPNDPLEPFFQEEPMKTVSGNGVEYMLSRSRIKIRLAEPVTSLAAMRRSLAAGKPVVIGLVVHESFYSAQVRRTGRIPLPAAGDRPIDGHAMLAVGYDDSQQVLVIRNSWGPDWGDRGYCYLPYEAASIGLLRDCWTVKEL